MSHETLTLMRTLDTNSIEARLAVQCAPVLAHVKVSNLLIAETDDLDKLHSILKDSAFSYYVIYQKDSLVYILIYEDGSLQKYLADESVEEFMKGLGYASMDLKDVLPYFAKRFKDTRENNADFPHEIGFLLGYPVNDVLSFIAYGGANCKYVGYWKVYHDVEESLRLFSLYDYVEEMAIALVYHNQSVLRLSEMQFAA